MEACAAALLHPLSFGTHINEKITSSFSSRNQSLRFQLSKPDKTLTTEISSTPSLVVVGSANADIYVEIDRLPTEGETISAKSGQVLPGGKGANQAACSGKLAFPTCFVAQVGDDFHGRLITSALSSCGVCVDHVKTVNVETGYAVVMLGVGGWNSIIIVGGANTSSWSDHLSNEVVEVVKSAGAVLLQREIPDFVNIQVAKVAKSARVPVVLDAGGFGTTLPTELLNVVDILSPNETELARITGMNIRGDKDVKTAAQKCHEMGVKQVLVKLGSRGSALFVEGEDPCWQPVIPAQKVIDTTGAGDTFTAAFGVAMVEGKLKEDCLRFAAAAASLCVQTKGAIPSMPDRASVLNLLLSL